MDATPIAPNPTPVVSRGVHADVNQPFLSGEAARQALDTAKAELTSGNIESALSTLLQLHHSDVAEAAITLEFSQLRSLGDWTTLAARVDALPVELLTAEARADGGYAHLALGDAARAAALVARVPANHTRARDAMLTMARALSATGKSDAANRLLETLAGGDDEYAAAAKQLLGR